VILSGTCSALEIQRVAACSGVVLRLRGDFKDGDYARFKSHFRKKDVIIGLDLSSDGGDLEDGMRIANLARQKKLSIYVGEECNSICAFVFFAAVRRYLGQNSRIGVHSVTNYRDIEDLSSMRLTLKLARLSLNWGLQNPRSVNWSPLVLRMSPIWIGATCRLWISRLEIRFTTARQAVDGAFQVDVFGRGRCTRRSKFSGPTLLELSLNVKRNTGLLLCTKDRD
jgi:hypothetical protein